VAGNSREAGRSVTSKVVAILETFCHGSIYSLTEIAHHTELPISTVHRLATELASLGLLERTTTRTTARAFRCGSSGPRPPMCRRCWSGLVSFWTTSR
jgi:IclR family transcriptional regulator, acetate operon repressor